MSIKSRRIEPHWNYLLALDADLVLLSRYVEFSEANFSCYSIEIARVLLAAAAEVDVVCKQTCRMLDAESTADDIHAYRRQLRPAFPELHTFEVFVPRFGLRLTPWAEWNKKQGVPKWWTANNKVKHERATQYHGANLQNALNAVGGLFAMVLHLNSEKARRGDLAPAPQLLRVGNANYGGEVVGNRDSGFCYEIPEPLAGDTN